MLTADPLPVSQAVKLIEMLESHDVHGLMYVDNAMLYEKPTGHVIRTNNWAQTLPPEQRPVFTQVDSLRAAASEVDAIWKFALTDEDTDKLRQWSWHDQVDIARSGNSKGKRLSEWVSAQGLSMKDVVAFGDNYNDISMLEAAGLGVAMGNADDAVKARANVVIGDNTTDSIASFIYSHLL